MRVVKVILLVIVCLSALLLTIKLVQNYYNINKVNENVIEYLKEKGYTEKDISFIGTANLLTLFDPTYLTVVEFSDEKCIEYVYIINKENKVIQTKAVNTLSVDKCTSTKVPENKNLKHYEHN